MSRLAWVTNMSLVFSLSLSILPGRVYAAAPWLNLDWSRRIELTVKPAKIVGSKAHNDLTLLLHATADSMSSVFTDAKPDGSDLIMTSGDGLTVIPHETVSYDPVGQDAEIWFRAGTLSAEDNVFYLYFGNPDTTVASTSDQAWSDEHLAVYHFEEDPGAVTQVSDSGPGDGSNPALVGSGSTWSSSDRVDTPIGKGWYFDGIDDWLYAQSVVSADSSFTVSAWFANTDLVNKGMIALQSLTGFWDISFVRSSNDPNAALRTSGGGLRWFPDVLDDGPHHYVWSMDAVNDTAYFFFDGVQQDVKINWTVGDTSKVWTGEPIQGRVGIAGPLYPSMVDRTKGVLDEYRVSEGASGADRIKTEHNNQVNSVAFYNYKQEFAPATAANPIGSIGSQGTISVWPNPFQYSAQIEVEFDDPSFAVRVYDLAGRLVRTLRTGSSDQPLMRLQWDGRDSQGRNVSSGIYYVRAVGERGSLAKKVMVIR